MQSRRQPLASTPEGPGAPRFEEQQNESKSHLKHQAAQDGRGLTQGQQSQDSPAAEVELRGACLSTHHELSQVDWRDQQCLLAEEAFLASVQ